MACLLIYTNDLKIPFPMLLYDCQCASDWTKYFFCLRKCCIFILKMHVWIFTKKLEKQCDWNPGTKIQRKQCYKKFKLSTLGFPLTVLCIWLHFKPPGSELLVGTPSLNTFSRAGHECSRRFHIFKTLD